MAVSRRVPNCIVNAIADGNQYRPFTTALATGGYVDWLAGRQWAGWLSSRGDISDDVRYAVYDAFGTRMQSALPISSRTRRRPVPSSRARRPASPTARMWWCGRMRATDLPATSINTRRPRCRSSTPMAEVRQRLSVNQTDAAERAVTEASVAVLSDGKFVVTWTNEDINASAANADQGAAVQCQWQPGGQPVRHQHQPGHRQSVWLDRHRAEDRRICRGMG